MHQPKFYFALLASLAVFALFVPGADACSCIPFSELHFEPQCPGRFLAIVNITQVDHSFFTNKYSYDVIADYTPKLAAKKSLNDFEVRTIISADNSATCGVILDVGKTYLLFGTLQNQIFPRMALCGSIARPLEKTPTQAEALEMLEKVNKERCVGQN